MFTNVYGTNSITIPADMDMSEDYRDSISPGSTASSFQPSSSMESTGFNNYFSQSVPSYQYQNIGMQHSPTNGLFPQLGSTLPESQQAAYFAATPTESSPSPATNDIHAGAMSFEDLLTMYYVNGNNNVAAAAAAAATANVVANGTTSTTSATSSSGIAITGTSSMMMNNTHSNEAPSLSHLSTGFSLPQSQGTILL